MGDNGGNPRIFVSDLIGSLEEAYGSPIKELDRQREEGLRLEGNVPVGKVMRALVQALRLVSGPAATIDRDRRPNSSDELVQLIIDLAIEANSDDAEPAEIDVTIAYLVGLLDIFYRDRDPEGLIPYAAYRSKLLCNRLLDGRMDARHPPKADEIDDIAELGARYGAEAMSANPDDWTAFVPSTPRQVRLAVKMDAGVTDTEWSELLQRLVARSAGDRKFTRTDEEVFAELDTMRHQAEERRKLEEELPALLRPALARLGLPEEAALSVKVSGQLGSLTAQRYTVELSPSGCPHGCFGITVHSHEAQKNQLMGGLRSMLSRIFGGNIDEVETIRL